jgi:hypothetical protein
MSSRPINCRITVRGRVARHWLRCLEKLRPAYRSSAEHGEVTDLVGRLPDQSALQGALSQIWNLNLTVLSLSTSPEEDGGHEKGGCENA